MGKYRSALMLRTRASALESETVQLYLRERFTPVATPVKQLRGFERVQLDPGQKKTVNFTLGPEELQLLDQDLQWKVVPGTFDVMIGMSSADVALKGSFEVRSSNPASSAWGTGRYRFGRRA